MVHFISRRSDIDREEYINPFISSKRNKAIFAIGVFFMYVFGIGAIVTVGVTNSIAGMIAGAVFGIVAFLGCAMVAYSKASDWWHRGDI